MTVTFDPEVTAEEFRGRRVTIIGLGKGRTTAGLARFLVGKGANVTIAQIEDHPELKKTFPGLQQAAAEVGSRQIRNWGTVGGNLAQHSRCWYYRHRDVHCLKKGGDLCYARHGDNRFHSLFTGNTCISPVPSNLAIALGALDATVIVMKDGQEKRMSIPELYAAAWRDPEAHNSLAPGDLVLRVDQRTGRQHAQDTRTNQSRHVPAFH